MVPTLLLVLLALSILTTFIVVKIGLALKKLQDNATPVTNLLDKVGLG